MYSKKKHIELLKSYWPIAYDKSFDSKKFDEFYNKIDPSQVSETNYSTIDNQTSNDLNVNDVFKEINICSSTAGEQLLYYILRTAKTSKSQLKERNSIINFLSKSTDIRANLQYLYTQLGILRKGSIISLLTTKNTFQSNYFISFILLSITSLIFTIYCLSLGVSSIPFLIAGLLVAQQIVVKSYSKYKDEMEGIFYLRKVIRFAHKISSFNNTDCEEFNGIVNNIFKHYEPIKKLRAYTLVIAPSHYGLPMHFINNVLFTDVIAHQLLLRVLDDHRANLTQLYYYIGQLDAFISIASYRERIGYYCEPKFIDNEKYLELQNAIHPLIIDGVANSITLDSKGVVITGSNMSGKSTFMRTMGLNILLAQTIYTPLCETYKASIFNIMSSLSISDDVKEGKSYYLGECEAILRILNNSNKTLTSFCIIDEIFKGTNPLERIAASKEILKYLSNNNTLTVVATHDLEIAETANDKFIHKYFCETVDDKLGLSFDYEIKDGICHTGNALKLLKHLKYPNEIINNAINSIANKQ